MADISLRVYLSDLERLLDRNAADEVILHSRHILQYYPKNVAAYGLLGRALILNGRWDEAEAAFRRVLAVIPDDLRAHLGLSELYDHKRRGDEAIWHIERALEQDPNNRQLIDQIRSLYKRYRNVEQSKIPLTASAVARQAMNNHAYEQAIETLRHALSRQPNRIDLHLLLAQALWAGGDPVEAAEAALDVLQTLPDCLTANRILTELWLQEDRPSDAQKYLARVEAVDPYLAVELASGQPADDNAFKLPESDVRLAAQSEISTSRPDWLQDIPDTPTTTDTSTGDLSNWTQTSRLLPRTGTLNPEVLGQAPVSSQSADEEEDELKALFSTDYLRSLSDSSAATTPASNDQASTPAFNTDSLFQTGDLVSDQSASDVPDWMSAATQQVPTPQPAHAQDDPMAWLRGSVELSEEDESVSGGMPADEEDYSVHTKSGQLDWMGGSDEVEEEPAQAEIPDWMQDPDPLARPRSDVLPSPADIEPVSDMPDIDWLTGDNIAQSALDEALGLEALASGDAAMSDTVWDASPESSSEADAIAGLEWLTSETGDEELTLGDAFAASAAEQPDLLTSSDTSLSRPKEAGLTDFLNSVAAEFQQEQATEAQMNEDDSWLEEISNEPASVPGPKKGLTALLNDASFDWATTTGSLQAPGEPDQPSDDWYGEFNAGAAEVEQEPSWLSELEADEEAEGGAVADAIEEDAQAEGTSEADMLDDDTTRRVPIVAGAAAAASLGAALVMGGQDESTEDQEQFIDVTEAAPDTTEIDVDAVLASEPIASSAGEVEEDSPFDEGYELESLFEPADTQGANSGSETEADALAEDILLYPETETLDESVEEISLTVEQGEDSAALRLTDEIESENEMSDLPAGDTDEEIMQAIEVTGSDSSDLGWQDEVSEEYTLDPSSDISEVEVILDSANNAAESAELGWIDQIEDDAVGVETIAFTSERTDHPDSIVESAVAASVLENMSLMENESPESPVSSSVSQEDSDWLMDAEAQEMTDEEANAVLAVDESDWFTDSTESSELREELETVEDEIKTVIFSEAGELDVSSSSYMGEEEFEALIETAGEEPALSEFTESVIDENIALEPADSAELAALFAASADEAAPSTEADDMIAEMDADLDTINAVLYPESEDALVAEAEIEGASDFSEDQPNDTFGLSAENSLLPAAAAAVVGGDRFDEEPGEALIEAVSEDQPALDEVEISALEPEMDAEMEEMSEKDIFDQMEAVEIAESEISEPAAENIPDWLNALVPGLDVDFKAVEDEPIETEFAVPEPEQVIGVEENETREFAWVEEIIEMENREMTAESSFLPSISLTVPRFRFSHPPRWFHQAANGAASSAENDGNDLAD